MGGLERGEGSDDGDGAGGGTGQPDRGDAATVTWDRGPTVIWDRGPTVIWDRGPTVIWDRARDAEGGAGTSVDQAAHPTRPGDAWSDTPASVAVRATVDAGTTDPYGDAWSDLPPTSEFVPGRPGEAKAIDALAGERSGLHLDQADNSYNTRDDFNGTCGLASATELLRDFGKDVDFDGVIDHALRHDQADGDGGTTEHTVRALLDDFGVPAIVSETADLDGLAGDLRHGHGVIALVDSTTLWGTPDADPDRVPVRDHAVYITGVDWDDRGHPVAFRLNDTGLGQRGRDQLVPADRLRAAFELPGGVDRKTGAVIAPGGHAIVTDSQRDVARMAR